MPLKVLSNEYVTPGGGVGLNRGNSSFASKSEFDRNSKQEIKQQIRKSKVVESTKQKKPGSGITKTQSTIG